MSRTMTHAFTWVFRGLYRLKCFPCHTTLDETQSSSGAFLAPFPLEAYVGR